MKILIVNGPNLNILEKRDPKKYGVITLLEINQELKKLAEKLDCQLEFFQSNHEGAIIDFFTTRFVTRSRRSLVNPGAF